MAYEKRTFVDGETPLDKELFDHLQDGIVALDEQVDALPSEFIKEAEDVAAECLDLDADLRILVFSDNHSYERNKYKKYTAIMNQGVFDYSIGLGDYVDYSHAEKPVAKANVLACLNCAGRKPNQIYVLGNHDVGICGVNAGTDSLDVLMSPKENFDVYCRHLKNNPNVHFNPSDPYGCYYYADDEHTKVRIIVFNTSDIFNRNPTEATENMTKEEYQASAQVIRYYQQLHVSQEQIDWLAHVALNFMDKDNPSEWSFITCQHWPNVFSKASKNIVAHIVTAAVKGEALNETIEDSTRLEMTEPGVYGKTKDATIVDTYTVDVDFTQQGAIPQIVGIYGHDHVDAGSYNDDGTPFVEVRCDNGGLDDYYLAPCTGLAAGTYYFYAANGTIRTFTLKSAIKNIGYIGYNDYWMRSKSTYPMAVFHTDGLRHNTIAISGVQYVTEIPEGATEITGFVRERDGSLVGMESCAIMCISKKNRTVTFVPYGTAHRRTFTY